MPGKLYETRFGNPSGLVNMQRVNVLASDSIDFAANELIHVTEMERRVAYCITMNFFRGLQSEHENEGLRTSVPMVALLVLRYVKARVLEGFIGNNCFPLPILCSAGKFLANTFVFKNLVTWVSNVNVKTKLKLVSEYLGIYEEVTGEDLDDLHKFISQMEGSFDKIVDGKLYSMLQGNFCSMCTWNNPTPKLFNDYGSVCSCGGYFAHMEELTCHEPMVIPEDMWDFDKMFDDSNGQAMEST